MRRVAVLVLGIALLALALVAAWLGRGLMGLPAVAARQEVAWEGSITLRHPRGDAAERLAAALDQRDRHSSFTRVVHLFRAATVAPRHQVVPTMAPVDAETAIAKLTPGLRSPKERSEAQTMLGILLAFAAGNGDGTLGAGQGTGGNLLLEQSRNEFQDAVRTDPGNEDAKVDLELLLQDAARTPKQSHSKKRGSRSKQRRSIVPPNRAKKRADVPQASYSKPGSGY
jgi:hypothetical protein